MRMRLTSLMLNYSETLLQQTTAVRLCTYCRVLVATARLQVVERDILRRVYGIYDTLITGQSTAPT